MAAVTVRNLSTGASYVYVGLTPRQAVAAAYAMYERKDARTDTYEAKYEPLVQASLTGVTVSLGDYVALA